MSTSDMENNVAAITMFIRAIADIWGVKKVSIDWRQDGSAAIKIHYSLWTLVVPWANRVVRNKVHKFISQQKPPKMPLEEQ